MTRPNLLLALAIAAGLIVGFALPTLGHCAPRRHHVSTAACDARIAKRFAWMLIPSDGEKVPDPVTARHLNLQGDYDFMVEMEQKQRCHHEDMGLDRPSTDRVVEVQVSGTVFVTPEP